MKTETTCKICGTTISSNRKSDSPVEMNQHIRETHKDIYDKLIIPKRKRVKDLTQERRGIINNLQGEYGYTVFGY